MKKYVFSIMFIFVALLISNVSKIEAANSIPNEISYTKQQFRGVWVTTVYNLDIPKHTSESQYKSEYLDILDNLEAMNMNAIIFQVRPMGGAFYQSSINPWDRYLTGIEGQGPGWDPLSWMVEEAHKRGIEFHAWFNPYRVRVSGASGDNIAVKHPEYLANNELLNPGEPAVQQHIIDTVMEVANNYDIDAIHFDDYFYPYSGLDSAVDKGQFEKYNPSNLSLADWRRENVNTVIRRIKEELTILNEQNQKSVQLGISPFGIWANKSSHPEGSNTSGGQSYYGQYADTRKWVEEEWIDYIAPQDYWTFATSAAPYDEVVDWWTKQVEGTNVNLYIGHGFYRYTEGWGKEEINNQLKLNSTYNEVDGSIFYRYKFLLSQANSNIIYGRESIDNHFKYKVLPRPVRNVDAIAPNKPVGLQITNSVSGYKLSWTKDEDAKAYYIYRYAENEMAYLHNIEKVIDIIYPNEDNTIVYEDTSAIDGINYEYYVTAFDRANNESMASGINTSNEVVIQDDDSILIIEDKIKQTEITLDNVKDISSELISSRNQLTTMYDELNNFIKLIKTDVENIDSEITLNQEDIDDIKLSANAVQANINNINNDINQLFLDLISKDVAEIQTSFETVNSDLMSIKNNYESLIEDINEKSLNYQQLTNDKSLINSNLQEFNSDFYQFSSKYSIMKSSITKLEEEFVILTSLIDTLNEDKTTIDPIYQTTINKINTLNQNFSTQTAIKNNLKNYFETLTTDKLSLSSEKSALYTQNSTLANGLIILGEDINELDTESLQTEFDNVDVKISELNNKLQDKIDANTEEVPVDDKPVTQKQDITTPIIISAIVLTGIVGTVFIIKHNKN